MFCPILRVCSPPIMFTTSAKFETGQCVFSRKHYRSNAVFEQILNTIFALTKENVEFNGYIC